MVVGAESTIFFDKKIQKNFFLKIWAKMHNISFSNNDLPPTTLYPPPLPHGGKIGVFWVKLLYLLKCISNSSALFLQQILLKTLLLDLKMANSAYHYIFS